jgi:hypothetical protein
MSYTINKTDGNVLLTLQDGTTDNSTGINLIGRNSVNYGDAQNENFVRLLENFADTLPPGQSVGFNPIKGTIWYSTSENRLRVYDGTNWNVVSGILVSATAPVAINIGDQWWDTTNYQLNSWTGSTWQLVGPGYTRGQGKSGAIVETIVDTNNQSHTIVNTYTNGNLISTTSFDATFTPLTSVTGLTTIQPGVNLVNGTLLNGLAVNSQAVGGVYANALARTDITSTFGQDLAVTGNLLLGNANIFSNSRTLVIQNRAYQGNVDFYLNTSFLGNVRAAYIDGNVGQLMTPSTPLYAISTANKGYVDTSIGVVNSRIDTTNGFITANIAKTYLDFGSNINTVVTNTNANLAAATTAIYGNLGALWQYTENSVSTLASGESALQRQINNLNIAVATAATIDSPNFTGTPLTNGQTIAPTAYVDSTATNILNQLYQTNAITQEQLTANIAQSVVGLAPISSPAFTGTPTAPTPTVGDVSNNIATTAFVQAAVNGNFRYTVSTSGPSGGNNGDFWFQV